MATSKTVAEATLGGLIATALAALAWRRLHDGPLGPDMVKSIQELEYHAEQSRFWPFHHPKTAVLAEVFEEHEAPLKVAGIGSIDGYTRKERFILRLRGLRTSGLSAPVANSLEQDLTEMGHGVDWRPPV